MRLITCQLSALLFFIFAFVFTQSVTAQNTDDLDYQTVEVMNSAGTLIYSEDTKDIQGSPLIKESFENGRILYPDNKASEVVPINYDAYKNQVLFIKNDQIRVLNTVGVKGFMFEKPENFEQTDKVQEVFTFQIRDKALGFDELTPVQVLYNQGSGIKLLALHKVNLMRGNTKDPFTGKVVDRYVSGVEYYLQKSDGEFEKLRRLRSKDIIRKLDRSHRKDLNNFMKENDLDGKSEKDLVKLLAYYDNLTASE
jgi:hypothetical protein